MRSEWVWRDRLNLSPENHQLLHEGPAAPPGHGGFESAWRNYLRAVFARGFVFTVSCQPEVFIFVCENKTLAGQEQREHEGEAEGRKLAVTFYEKAGGLVRPVDREGHGLKLSLLTVAEILQTLGAAVPPDAERPASQTEVLFEAMYLTLDIQRFVCTTEPDAAELNAFSLSDPTDAEATLAAELLPKDRTKMVLARCLQKNMALHAGETLQTAWALPKDTLAARAAHLFPAAPAAPPPAPPAAGPAPPAPLAARGRGRGRGAAAAAGPAPPAPRGRGRGRGGRPGRGRG